MLFEVLARGRWAPEALALRWREEPYALPGDLRAAADAELAALAARGSPSHDSRAVRLRGCAAENGRLALDLEPIDWSVRLVRGRASDSLAVVLLVRDADGRWLAGRRAPWLGIWPGRWMLGAAGGVGWGEDPAAALSRELAEEWELAPSSLDVRGLARLTTGMVWLVGSAEVAAGATPTPNDEHDAWAWWPADTAAWPAEADDVMRELATRFG